MKIIAFPKNGISYNDQFYAAVESLGARVDEGVFSGRWLWRNVRAGDIVHLHWPSFSYTGASSRAGEWVRFARFVALLLVVKLRGGRILWTAHNLMPHEPSKSPRVDALARRIVIALSDRVFVHGARAGEILAARFPSARRKSVPIWHGHWLGYYRRDVSRDEARRDLGIDERRFVYLFIGLCKEYKNLDGLIRAYADVAGDSVLLIAGRFASDGYRRTIEALARDDPRIVLDSRFIPDDEMQRYLVACDAVVAPYRDILTSGTAMLALTFGRPLVSVKLGCLLDVVTPQTGILYDPDRPGALADALEDIRGHRFDEREIIEHARCFDWQASARAFLGAIG